LGDVVRGSKLHTGLIVPERVITNFNEFADQDFIPNWLSSLPTAIEALCAKWQIELEPTIADTWMTVVLFGTSPALGPVVMKSSPNTIDFVAQARAFEKGFERALEGLRMDVKHAADGISILTAVEEQDRV
jgi:hypothetical protein